MEETKRLRGFLGAFKRTDKSYDLIDRSLLQWNYKDLPRFPFSGETEAFSKYSFVGQTSVFSSNEELAKLKRDLSQSTELALPLPFDDDLSSKIFDGGWWMLSATRGKNHIALIFSMDPVTYDVQDFEFEFHKRGSDIRERGDFPLGR